MNNFDQINLLPITRNYTMVFQKRKWFVCRHLSIIYKLETVVEFLLMNNEHQSIPNNFMFLSTFTTFPILVYKFKKTVGNANLLSSIR
jgi:hypothetical protein